MPRKAAVLIIMMLICFSLAIPGLAESQASGGPLRPIPGTTPTGVPYEELEDFVDEYAGRYVGQRTVGAAVVIVKDGEIILSKGYGYTDMELQQPVDPQRTVWEWGSISKLTVWTAVMQLVEQGKLDLDTDIRSYLPDGFLTQLSYDEPITMLDLMNHSAGFEEYMFDLAYQSPDDVQSLEEGLRLAEPAQVYRPGENIAYSNYSTALAAYIVEQLTGFEFHTYAENHIFSQLDMKQTSAHPTLSDRPELLTQKAKGYYYQGNAQFEPGPWNYMSMYPAGGINGTAEDLARFAMAFMPAEGQSSPLFHQITTLSDMLATSHSSAPQVPGIAHGFWEYAGEHGGLGHTGNTMVFTSNLLIVPEEGLGIVVMSNQASEADMVHGLVKALAGRVNVAPPQLEMPSAATIEGSYIAARRPHHGFMSLYPYLSLMKIAAVDEQTIQLAIAGAIGEYVQTHPYVYEKVSGHSALDAWSVLYAQVEGDKVMKVAIPTSDYLPLPAGKSIPMLTTYAIVAIIVILYFLSLPILLIVPPVRRKWRFSPSLFWLSLTGMGLILNNGFLALRMLSNYERAYAEVYPHLVVNYIFTGIGLVLSGIVLSGWRKQTMTLVQKSIRLATALLMLLLVALLVMWQFYS
ncbi:serine hydrolase domain-containing protein [Paenibacillus daejeonensis]|uniref:serine hydrolase domain-containing protein n=1 Tax=Paenibacillus daejeonensis TaxID=135193 RepID=UPI000A02310B|nr:serine hydrolase domain-containing protein [Paenibacillus daejeonensis]